MALSCISALLLTTAYVGSATPVCESTYTSSTTVACDNKDLVLFLQFGASVSDARLTRVISQSAQSGSFSQSSPLLAKLTDSAHSSSAPFVQFAGVFGGTVIHNHGTHSYEDRAALRPSSQVALVVIVANSLILVGLYLVRSAFLSARAQSLNLQAWTESAFESQRPASSASTNYMPAPEIILMLCSVVFMFACTDQYLGSMPDMAQDLNSSVASVSATIQTNWVIKGVCSLFIGAISDHIGRRPCILFCAMSLTIATAICAGAPNMPCFMFGRVFQGVGEGGVTVYFAVVRDYFDDEQLRLEVTSLGILVIALVPILAPCAGGLLASWVGWRSSFVILFNAGLYLLVAVYMIQKESAPSCTGGQAQGSMLAELSQIWNLIVNRYLATLIFAAGFGFTAVTMILDCVNGYVMETQYGKSVVEASLFIGSYGFSILAGGMLTLTIASMRPLRTVRVFMLLVIIPIAFPLIVARFLEFSPWWFMSAFYVHAFWGMTFSSSANVLLLQPYKGQSGAVSGIAQSFSQIVGAAVSAIGTQVAVQHQAHGVLCFSAAIVLFSAIVFWIGFGLHPPDWAFEAVHDGEK